MRVVAARESLGSLQTAVHKGGEPKESSTSCSKQLASAHAATRPGLTHWTRTGRCGEESALIAKQGAAAEQGTASAEADRESITTNQQTNQSINPNQAIKDSLIMANLITDK